MLSICFELLAKYFETVEGKHYVGPILARRGANMRAC